MHAPDEPEERRRKRLYNRGALAQSFVPRGVAELLKLDDRARARARWRARARGERALLTAIYALETACAAALFVGLMTGSAALLLGSAGGFLTLLVGTAAITVVTELRRARRWARRPGGKS